ncbi:MAG TPA: putative Ig domain-containing protein, partial [Vicinamibacterales bacterium]
QLQWNPFNIRLFNRMTVAGTTDYNWITTETIVPADPVGQPGVWTRNAGQLGDPFVFYSWTDGRNIKLVPNEDYSKPRPYTAPNLYTLTSGGQSVFDPTQNRPACSDGTAGTKNLDVYGALKTQGVFAGAPGNNKSPANVDRSFTVFGQNMTSVEKILRFAVTVQPPGGAATMATFNQRFPSVPFAPQVMADAVVGSKNVVARTVYVPQQPQHPVAVDVAEVTAKPIAMLTSSGMIATAVAPGHGYQAGQAVIVAGANEPAFNGTFAVASVSGDTFTYVLGSVAPAMATGTPRTALVSNLRAARRVWLNFDPTQPANLAADTTQGDGFDINKFEVYNVEFSPLDFTEVQEIGFPTVNGEGWQTPAWQTPAWQTPAWQTPAWQTPAWQTPAWQTPAWQTPAWQTPAWQTPSLSDAEIQNSSIIDVPRKLKNNSNSYVSVNVHALVNGAVPDFLKFQAVAYKLYTTTGTDGCQEHLVGNTQVLLNLSNLDVSAANFNSPADSSSLQNATLFLAPNEEVYFNVRVYDTAHRGPGANTFDPTTLLLKATPQPVGTVDVINGVTTPPPAYSDLVLLAAALPAGQAGQPYSAAIQALGGTPPLTFSATGLPGGITIGSATGALSGTTGIAGDFPVSVTVADAASQSATRTYALHIDPGPAASLAFLTEPSPTTAGQSITPAPQVKVLDDFGNLVTPSSAAITLTLGNAQGATLLGTTTRSASFGVATFPGLSINQVGDGYQLVAASNGLTGATSSSFDITAPPPSTLTVLNTDFASAGFGGMRGDGTGTITLEGVSGSIKKALLIWHGPTNSTNITANSTVSFGGQQVNGTNIGLAYDNTWGFANSHSYRADVTSLVTGDGTYALAGFRKTGNNQIVADVNGASLIVFFDDGNSANNRDVYLRATNDSNVLSPYDADDWSDVLTGVNYAVGTATLQLHVGDGQGYFDGAISLNGTEVVAAGPTFQGNTVPNGPNPGGIGGEGPGSGGLWDIRSWPIPEGVLTAGSNTITLTSPAAADALSLVVMIVSVPHVP